MRILFLEGSANEYSQENIHKVEPKNLTLVFEANNYENLAKEIVQMINDDFLDTTNNFHTIREV